MALGKKELESFHAGAGARWAAAASAKFMHDDDDDYPDLVPYPEGAWRKEEMKRVLAKWSMRDAGEIVNILRKISNEGIAPGFWDARRLQGALERLKPGTHAQMYVVDEYDHASLTDAGKKMLVALQVFTRTRKPKGYAKKRFY